MTNFCVPQRYLIAQEDIIEAVVNELRVRCKRSRYTWYIPVLPTPRQARMRTAHWRKAAAFSALGVNVHLCGAVRLQADLQVGG